MVLSEVCCLITDRISVDDLSLDQYISTENILPDKGGITLASSKPESGSVIKFEIGDILISNIRPYFKKIWKATFSGGCSPDVMCFRAHDPKISDYIYYNLSQQDFFDFVMAGANGAKMPRGSKTHTLKWEILDLPNKEKIAAVLSSLDDKIETNRAINARLEELASAIFKSWFIDFEPFADSEFVEDEYGRRPQGWKVVPLSEISSIVMGQSPEGASLNTESGTLFYQGCSEFGTRFPSVKKFTTSPLRYAEPFSVLLSVRAPVGALNVAYQKCCIGRGLASISSVYKSFVLYTLKNYQSTLERYNCEGTVFGCIKKSDVENIPVLLPPKEILERFEKIIQPIDSLIFNNFYQEQNLSSLRDTLLPRLMSGELIPE